MKTLAIEMTIHEDTSDRDMLLFTLQCLYLQCSVSIYTAVSLSTVQCLYLQYSVSIYSTVSVSTVQCLYLQYSVSIYSTVSLGTVCLDSVSIYSVERDTTHGDTRDRDAKDGATLKMEIWGGFNE